jgi:lipooligosaccharide transport system permease protein
MSIFGTLFRLPTLSTLCWTVWQRNMDVYKKTFKVNFVPPLLEPILYLLALGFGLGFFLKEIEGISYTRFIAPALFSITTMYASFFECTYASYVRMYYQKTFDAIIATPVNIEEVVAGEMLSGATKSFINGAIVLGVIAVFGLVDFRYVLLLLPFGFIVGLLFAALGMICTAIVPSIDSFNYPVFLFITPMFLFSGTFFPMSILPSGIRVLAYGTLPLTHVVKISRGLTLGVPDLSLVLSLLWIVVVAVVAFVLAINLMRRRLIH